MVNIFESIDINKYRVWWPTTSLCLNTNLTWIQGKPGVHGDISIGRWRLHNWYLQKNINFAKIDVFLWRSLQYINLQKLIFFSDEVWNISILQKLIFFSNEVWNISILQKLIFFSDEVWNISILQKLIFLN